MQQKPARPKTVRVQVLAAQSEQSLGAPGRNRTCNLPLAGESYIHLTTETKRNPRSITRRMHGWTMPGPPLLHRESACRALAWEYADSDVQMPGRTPGPVQASKARRSMP